VYIIVTVYKYSMRIIKEKTLLALAFDPKCGSLSQEVHKVVKSVLFVISSRIPGCIRSLPMHFFMRCI